MSYVNRVLSLLVLLSMLLSPVRPLLAQSTGTDQPVYNNFVYLPEVQRGMPMIRPMPAPDATVGNMCPEPLIENEVVCTGDHVCEVVRKCKNGPGGGTLYLANTQAMGNPVAQIGALIMAYAVSTAGTQLFTWWITSEKEPISFKIPSYTLGKDYVSSFDGAGKQSYTFEGATSVKRVTDDLYQVGYYEATTVEDHGDYREYGTQTCPCYVYDAKGISDKPAGLLGLYQLIVTAGTEIRAFIVTNQPVQGRTTLYAGSDPGRYLAEIEVTIPTLRPGAPDLPNMGKPHSGDEVKAAKRLASWRTLFNWNVDNYDPDDPCKHWDWVGYRIWPSGDRTYYYVKYALEIFASDGKTRNGLALVLNNENPTALDQLKPVGAEKLPSDPMRPRGPSWFGDKDGSGNPVTWGNAKDEGNCPDPTGLVPVVVMAE